MNGATEANGQNTPPPQENGEQSLIKQTWNQACKPPRDLLKWMSSLEINALYALVPLSFVVFDLVIYFPILGILAFEAPITAGDIVRSSVIWIPPFLVATIVTFSVSWVCIYASKWIHESADDIKKFFMALGASTIFFAIFLAGMNYISLWFYGFSLDWNNWIDSPCFWLVGGLLFSILVIVFRYTPMKSKDPKNIFVGAFVNFALFIVLSAVIQAQFGQSKPIMKDCKNRPTLIRSFEKFILINRCGDLEFMNTDQIALMKIEGGEIIVIPKKKTGGSASP